MKKYGIGCAILGGLLLVALIVLALGASGYNRLVNLNQAVNKQWAQVENVYQRRADLVPNLVATVSGAANFEKSTLVDVVNARASVGQVHVNTGAAPTDPKQLAAFDQAQTRLTSALSRLLVVVERYPELRANESFRELQAQLEGTENRIAVERGRYNETVQAYNTAVHSFPAMFFAWTFGFRDKPYFQAKPGAETAPNVQFNFNNPQALPEAPQQQHP